MPETLPNAAPSGLSPAYEVRPSRIHGRGLFALRRIAEGDAIGTYEGPRTQRVDDHVLWIYDEAGNEYGIDGRNELRFVNHSRRPNAVFEEAELVALRDIEPGEELTHDYGEDWADL